MRLRAVPLALVAGLGALAGCTPAPGSLPYMHLVDQRDFAGRAPPPPVDPHPLPPLPLATIRFVTADLAFAPALDEAVDAAISRKADAIFDVILPLPKGVVPDAAAQDRATRVAREIAERSVAPDHIHIGVAEDSGAAAREVRVYVR